MFEYTKALLRSLLLGPGGGAVFLLLIVTAMNTSRLPAQEPLTSSDRWNRAALEWIGLLRGGAFQEASARVDPAVPEGAMSAERLEAIWSQLSTQVGTLESVGPGPVSEQGVYHIVDLPATFSGQALVLRVVLTDELLVSGFFLRPPEPTPYSPPPYVDESRFSEEEVTVGAEPWLLPGVLTIPKGEGPVPAVVLVHGSGPNDRDETLGNHRPFRDLAWGLASQGIAVLRYDKRTRAHGPRIPPDIGLEDEVISDALSALALVRARPEVDPGRVFVLGHSLGGILAPEIGRRSGRLAGIIILAATARPFFEVLIDQLEYVASLEEDPTSPARAQIDSVLAAVRRVESGEAPEGQPVLGAPPAYWREVASLDPIAVARELSAPILVLQGGRDYQSTTEDLEIWESELGEKEGFAAKLYPGLNHLFASGTGMATPEEYASSESHVAEEVILDLSSWIQSLGR